MNATPRIPDAADVSVNTRIVLRADGREIPMERQDERYLAPGVELTVTSRPLATGTEITLRPRIAPERTIESIGLHLGPFALNDADRFFCEIPGFLEQSGVLPARRAQDEEQASILLGLLVRPGQTACLLGIGARHPTGSSFSLRDDHLCARFRPQARTGNRDGAYTFYVAFGADPLELLRRYGAHLASFARQRTAHTPSGWNSWDFYGGAISMADVERELAAARTLSCRDQLHYATLDMGWEEAWGNWIPNRRFPETFSEIADRIRGAGWTPGIWTAPLQVSLFTPLARHRQELFLRNAEGGLLILQEDMPCGPALLLDVTLPEVRDLLGSWYGAMRQAGFELFKIDYLYNRFLALATHAAGGPDKVAFARALLGTIRDAVGPDAHILNCGGNKEAALGLVDSSRISMDIHTFWSHIRNNSRQVANGFWMNGALWTNDPDFAILRTPENCSARYNNMPYTQRTTGTDGNFWMSGPEASLNELRLWLSVVRLNGGSLFLADSLAALSAEGRADLARLFPPLDAGFDPLDLFERRHPGVWLSRSSSRPTAGLFNWEDTPQTLDLPDPLRGPLTGREFWTGTPIRLHGEVRLEPRGGLLLEL